MTGNLLRLSNIELKKILKDSSILETIIKSDASENAPRINIDQSWEAIYYLLTGCPLSEWDNESQPLSWVMFNLEQFVDEEQDFGYGPANYSTSEEVKQIAKALKNITGTEIRKKYNSKKLLELEIYPAGTWDTREETISFLVENFENLKKFYLDAAEKNEPVIFFLN